MYNNLDKLLPFVQRPARYINHEINSHKPDMSNDVSVCMCFPDIYEIGASNLGLEILYHLINEKKLARAERAYSPDIDLEKLLLEKNIELFSLESQSPIKSFDIVSFSLQCELVGTNIVNMLSLAKIPVFSKDRTEENPLIIAGGPVMANPEPFADFFDLFVIGDGEQALEDIINTYRQCKKNKKTRKEILKELSKIKGVYIPSFYEVKYNDDLTVNSVLPVDGEIKPVIQKTTVDIEKSFFHTKKIVPYVQTVHNRLNIEIARGCIGQCRFCQASKYYRPWRARSPENILNLLDKGLAATGYEEVSFSSLSCTDYKNLEELLLKTNEKYSSKNITVSLPSMRCNQFSLKVAEYINRDKKPTITFAPEAGSDRLRNVIGKYLSETDIINTLKSANEMGWKTIKLYFMIGLPTETEHDIQAIIDLIHKVKQVTKGLNFNITISPFVPKAHTAFQWQAMFPAQYFADVINRLKKNVPATIKAHDYKESIIEAVLARGDRKLSKAIYIAWQKGLRFDQWIDRFNYDIWIQSVSEAGLNLDFYVYRQRDKNEILPWQHINLGLTKDILYADYLKGISETDNCDYTNYKRDINLPKNYSLVNNLPTQPSVRVLLKFSREGVVKYLSQLEQIDFLRRALKRTSLPVAYTAGFSPLVKTSFGPAVSVGHESDCEYVDLYMTEKIPEENITAEISKVLPGGYKILQAKYLPLKFPAINSLVNAVEYIIEGVNITQEQIDSFLNQEKILITKVKKQKETIIDVKEQILKISKISYNKIKMLLEIKQQNSVKLSNILCLLLNLNENQVKILYIKRTKLFVNKENVFYEI